MVYYRKYRPQNISQLDSESLRDRLTSVLSGNLPHAFLFTGPKGLGKTSTARIVAKVINCERLATSKLASSSKEKKLNPKRYSLDASIEPCNECSQCISITNGTNMDVLEIDAASNRGIDEIRDLRDKIRLAPVGANKKVYIIDEVHMLTTEAFNALLKTLEEPPEHVVFILCTTELHKVPETIISRCTHVQFEKAQEEDFLHSFSRIVTGENLSIDKEVLVEIAKMSEGSFRDGAKLLEEIVSIAQGKKITKELIEGRFKTSTISQSVEKMRSYLKQPSKTQEALTLIDSLVTQGVDSLYFLEKLIEDLHRNLLIQAGVIKEEKPEDYLTLEELKPLIELLTKAYIDTKYAVIKQLPLELAIIEWGLRDKNHEKTSKSKTQSPPIQEVKSQEPQVVDDPNKTSVSIAHAKNNETILQELIDKVKLTNQTVAGVLRGTKLKEYDGKKLFLETQFKFHKDKLDERKTRELLHGVLKEITGNIIELEVLLTVGK